MLSKDYSRPTQERVDGVGREEGASAGGGGEKVVKYLLGLVLYLLEPGTLGSKGLITMYSVHNLALF